MGGKATGQALVLENRPLSRPGAKTRIHLLRLLAPEAARRARPGQFVMLKARPGPDPILARPFSVHYADSDELHLLFRVAGRGTHILSQTSKDAELAVWGPLGRGFDLEAKQALLVAGGMGWAPFRFLARRLEERGAALESVVGADNADTLRALLHHLPGLDHLKNMQVATEDGSAGAKGLVIGPMADALKRADMVYTCGPLPMLRAVTRLWRPGRRGLPGLPGKPHGLRSGGLPGLRGPGHWRRLFASMPGRAGAAGRHGGLGAAMSEDLELFLKPAPGIECDHPDMLALARKIIQGSADDIEAARKLFDWARDMVAYSVYVPFESMEDYLATSTLARGRGFCVQKATVLCTLARAAGIPARLAFADIRNHLLPPYMLDILPGGYIYFHCFLEWWLQDRWVKSTPSFDKELTERQGWQLVEFDPQESAMLPATDLAGRPHVEYTNYRGWRLGVPLEEFLESILIYSGPILLEGWRKLTEQGPPNQDKGNGR